MSKSPAYNSASGTIPGGKGGKAIHHHNFVPEMDQLVNQVGPNKAAAAGYNPLH